jgi:hypothetical protein
MPADKNLILLTNTAATVATITSASVDIGMGGTPITHPLVARCFWSAAAATGTLTVTVEAAFESAPGSGTPGAFRQVAIGDLTVGPAAETNETGIRFVTRRRYVRAVLAGAVATGVTVAVMDASRSSPESPY